MVKILEAECSAGVVTAEGAPLAGATILSDGVTSSEGIAILDGEQISYIAKTSDDLKAMIEKTAEIVSKIVTMLTAIDVQIPLANGVGGTAIAPNVATIPELTALNVELQAMKDLLR